MIVTLSVALFFMVSVLEHTLHYITLITINRFVSYLGPKVPVICFWVLFAVFGIDTFLGGGGMQPGAARFSIPYLGDSKEGKGRGERGADGQANIVASLNHKELGKSQVATLEVGDEIEADLWRSKLGGGKVMERNHRTHLVLLVCSRP